MRSRERNASETAPSRLRCAIYTRKSTEEGLDQEFNSLDAQREAAEAFIRSQRREGWIALPEFYDDGGFTGANMDRPALGRLLKDVEAGELDCVVVYKVDRLSRSLLDFTRMLSIFEEHNVSFVAVTQQFNTSTSLGRLTRPRGYLFIRPSAVPMAMAMRFNRSPGIWEVSISAAAAASSTEAPSCRHSRRISL